MGFDSVGSDESSLFDLAKRAEGFLMGFLQIGTDYRLEFDELLIFLLIGVLNISRQQDSFLFVPASMARINAVVKLSKESLRRRLLELQGKGLVVRSRQGFSVNDFVVWRGLAMLLGPAPVAMLAAAAEEHSLLESEEPLDFDSDMPVQGAR